MQKLLLIVSLFAGLTSCDKSTDLEPEPQVPDGVRRFENVDQELWPYFTRFEDEGKARGITVDLSARKIEGSIFEIPDDGVAGDCTFREDDPNTLRVDRETWDNVSEVLREYIVFHELGHCTLIRKHRETADNRGVCLSIMASGTGDCREAFMPSTRARLLDELFDPAFIGDWE